MNLEVGPLPPFLDDGVACTPLNAEDFFPTVGGNPAAARATCAKCPVRVQCLQWAIDNREAQGIWGGMSPTERKAIIAAIPPPCAMCGEPLPDDRGPTRMYCGKKCSNRATVQARQARALKVVA